MLACAPSALAAHPPPQPVISSIAEASDRKLSFEISVDGQELGRFTVRLFDDVPVGTERFAQLAEGLDGASYRRSKFSEIYPVWVDGGGGGGGGSRTMDGMHVHLMHVHMRMFALHTHTPYQHRPTLYKHRSIFAMLVSKTSPTVQMRKCDSQVVPIPLHLRKS